MLAVVRCTIVKNYRRQAISALNNQQSRCDSTMKSAEEATTTTNKIKKIDRSKVPILIENELEEQFVSGSGPGGQSVNKSVNCCQLKHKPTGLIVKVHQSRSLEENRKIARELLALKLDNLYNGEESIINQKKRLVSQKLAMKEAQQERLQTLKQTLKKRLLEEEEKKKYE